jgi:hypothetical protein
MAPVCSTETATLVLGRTLRPAGGSWRTTICPDPPCPPGSMTFIRKSAWVSRLRAWATNVPFRSGTVVEVPGRESRMTLSATHSTADPTGRRPSSIACLDPSGLASDPSGSAPPSEHMPVLDVPLGRSFRVFRQLVQRGSGPVQPPSWCSSMSFVSACIGHDHRAA